MTLTRRNVLPFAALAAPLAVTALIGTPMIATDQTTAKITDSADAPIRPGAPLLLVRDLHGMVRYYEQTIGLHVIDTSKDEAQLGAGGRVLLTLRHRAGIDPEPRGFAGLFHTAFLLQDRAALGRWLARAIENRVAFAGAADHLVSEALYLTDPEGNGIEIYVDRPRGMWRRSDAGIEMASLELDVRGLIAAGGSAPSPTSRMPDDVSVGHIHLAVGGIAQAEAFYNALLNFDMTARIPGATFYSTGGYHHHVATNTWNSAGAPKRAGSITGLAAFDLLAKDSAAYDAMADKMLAAGATRSGDVITLPDPWGNLVQLKHAV